MASALLALANPVYKGFQAETKFIEGAGEDKIGKPLSMKRIKSIPLGFQAFGKGFLEAGGAAAVKKAGAPQKAQHGGMIRPHASSRGNAMVAGVQHGSARVLGDLPHPAMLREAHRSTTALH